MMRLGKIGVVLLAAIFFLGATQTGWTQEKKQKKKKGTQFVAGAVQSVGKRTILLDIGKRRPIVIPVEPGVTQFKKVSTDAVKMGDLTKGDVVIIKYGKNKFEPVPYVIQTGEKAKKKKKKKKR